MWTRQWICLSFLVVAIQSRHFPSHHHHHHHQNQQSDEFTLGPAVGHKKRSPSTEETALRDGGLSAEENYEPVVLKLEVHFRKKRKKSHHLKGLKKSTHKFEIASDGGASLNQSAGGFIHLFLPLSMSAASTSASVATPKPWPPVASAPPESSYVVPEPRKQHKKKSTKKKVRIEDDVNQQISWKKKKKKKMKDFVDQKAVASSTESSGNRLLPLMQDDGIPPLLNSLSANETQLWSRWLRCTLCLKNGKQTDNEAALCNQVSADSDSNRRKRRSSNCHTNVTVENELNASGCQETDVCTDWQECENQHSIPAMFSSLPPCPCTYPTGLVYNDRVWDPLHRHHFRWREISLESERVDIYRPGAVYCIRSLSVIPRMALAAQQCCYDDRRRLLTRGWAAGTPALVSPEASVHLSRVTERLPWLACKGDFSRYHLQRPPDNRLNCSLNPSDQEFQRQVLLATNY